MSDKNQATGVIGWVDERLPILSFIRDHLTHYYAPKNFNFWYFFGSFSDSFFTDFHRYIFSYAL